MTEENRLKEALKKAKAGDLSAFEILVLHSENMAYSIALRMMGSPEDAMDILQESYIKAYKNINRFNERSSFSTWIYRITVNTCLDELRRRKNKSFISLDTEKILNEKNLKHQHKDPSPTPDEILIHKEKTEALLSAIDNLSLDYKTVLVLRDIEGISYDEIAEIIGASLGTVKSRIHRARNRLKEFVYSKTELFENYNSQNL